MELLKGHTLRERLAARPLKIHEAVDIGIQVADALYWAHSRTSFIATSSRPISSWSITGQVKILDFGLAKFVAPQAGSETTVAPTIDLTGVGVALGTVAYMSPEQVSGDVARSSHRSVLARRRAVRVRDRPAAVPGQDIGRVLASILTQHADSAHRAERERAAAAAGDHQQLPREGSRAALSRTPPGFARI